MESSLEVLAQKGKEGDRTVMAYCLHRSAFSYKEIFYEGERAENLRKSTDVHNRGGFPSMETANSGTVYISFGGFFRTHPFKNYMLVES